VSDPIDCVLEVYSLTEVIEQNDLTEEDVLRFLVEQEFVELPDPKALDFDD
jgi:hypothetical protein